jgi:hypothetical protein
MWGSVEESLLAQQGASLFDEQDLLAYTMRFDNEATRVSSEIPARDLLADIQPPVPSRHLSLNATRRHVRRLVRKEAA